MTVVAEGHLVGQLKINDVFKEEWAVAEPSLSSSSSAAVDVNPESLRISGRLARWTAGLKTF